MKGKEQNENEINNDSKKINEIEKDDEVFLAPENENPSEEDNSDNKKKKINYRSLLIHAAKTKFEV